MANHKIIPMTDDARFCGEVCIDGRMKIQGIYDIAGTYLAHYSVSRQKETAAYCLRGTVSLRGADNTVLKMTDNNGKITEARLPIAMRSTDTEEIKREIAEKARKLYAVFAGSGKNDSTYVPIAQMSFAVILRTYGEEYAQAKSPGNCTRQKDRLHNLRDVAAGITETPYEKISQRQLAELCADFGATWYEKIREAELFMNYTIDRRKYEQISNPFARYRAARKKPRNAGRLQNHALSTDVLSREEQQKTVELVLQNIGEDDYAGIGLLLGTGLNAKQVVELRYGDIREDPDNKGILIVDYYRPELAGSMHDFSFVLSRLGERIYRERKAILEKDGLSPKEIAERYILTNTATQPYRADKLGAACRNILHNCGVGFSRMAELHTQTEGAGVRLLRNTYGLRLKEDGGLEKDPALLKYMLHSRPDGTQGVYYRSFTDIHARRYQAIVHRRIQWMSEKRSSMLTTVDMGDAGEKRKTQKTIKLKDDEKTVEARIRIRLQPGQSVRIRSGFGVCVKWEAEAST